MREVITGDNFLLIEIPCVRCRADTGVLEYWADPLGHLLYYFCENEECTERDEYHEDAFTYVDWNKTSVMAIYQFLRRWKR